MTVTIRLLLAIFFVALACLLVLALASFDAVAKKVNPPKKCQPWRETCNVEWKA
jgi:DMSO/TMAO reductase YedYZ heme-binding membrane subunit